MNAIDNLIVFPYLNLHLNVPPIAFVIGGLPVHWYGIIIAISILAAMVLAFYLTGVQDKNEEISGDFLCDTILLAIVCAIIGARIYYCIFAWSDFSSFADVFKIWQGGIAIYGGIIGGALAVAYMCHRHKKRFLLMADIFAPCVALGQAIGRWGNFFNHEAHGGYTTSLFRMEMVNNMGKYVCAHPTFLYESVWNAIGCAGLIMFAKSKLYKKRGEILFIYIIWYGIGRFLIEGLRTDSLYWGAFRVSQVLALSSAIVALGLLVWNRLKYKSNKSV
ncbi:MAG: prolipoprotein diacylglyceryl transferase [Clostridiales bacterium]|jgi:phosphatidylglycerol:prolipoprotein diacylglycerol transferase|nr:prolipoprotein diacylglyceryl transferase [Clostridiales bacterium]